MGGGPHLSVETTESTRTSEQTTDVASPRHCHLDKHGPTGLEALPTSRPLTPRWNQHHPIVALTFKELVASYAAGDTSFTDLALEVRCESCFASVMDEASQQLGPADELIKQLADEFPSMQNTYIKERGLDF